MACFILWLLVTVHSVGFASTREQVSKSYIFRSFKMDFKEPRTWFRIGFGIVAFSCFLVTFTALIEESDRNGALASAILKYTSHLATDRDAGAVAGFAILVSNVVPF